VSRWERENVEEMAVLAPRSYASGRQHGCPRRAIHAVLGIHGWMATTSSGSQHCGSLLGCLHAYLHGHGPVGGLAALPLIQCFRPWSSGGLEKNGREEGSVGDQVYPRQCPCQRAFNLGSVLGTWRTRRRSDESKGTREFTQVRPPWKVKGLRPACLTLY
jgi:hypothetical protein